MYKGSELRKFIISTDGELRIGAFCEHRPYMHKELLYGDSTCYGGGYVHVFPEDKKMLLVGESYDFGKPQFDKWRMFMSSSGWKFYYRTKLEDEESEIELDTSNVEFWDW